MRALYCSILAGAAVYCSGPAAAVDIIDAVKLKAPAHVVQGDTVKIFLFNADPAYPFDSTVTAGTVFVRVSSGADAFADGEAYKLAALVRCPASTLRVSESVSAHQLARTRSRTRSSFSLKRSACSRCMKWPPGTRTTSYGPVKRDAARSCAAGGRMSSSPENDTVGTEIFLRCWYDSSPQASRTYKR